MNAPPATSAILVEIETEAAAPIFRCAPDPEALPLERAAGGLWRGTIPLQGRSTPLQIRLEFDDPDPGPWRVSLRRGPTELYRMDSGAAGDEASFNARVAFEPEPAVARHRLRNRSQYRLGIESTDRSAGVVQLAPWSERELDDDTYEQLDLEPWTTRGLVTAGEVPPDADVLSGIGIVLLAGVFYVPVVAGIWAIIGTVPADYWSWAALVVLGAMVVAPLVQLAGTGRFRSTLVGIARRAVAAMAGFITAGVTLGIAFGIPGAVIGIPTAGETGMPIGRALQLLLIGVLSALPALLYFLFDRRKLAGLRQRFFQSVVQLDPDLRTLEDAVRVHGVRADEALGPAPNEPGKARLQLSRQAVIAVATLVTTVGWILTLNPIGPPPTGELFRFIQPMKDPLVFAFLGGYVFGTWMLLRRYFRSDLKPEAYAHVVTRMIAAVAITWALAQLPFVQVEAAGGDGQVPRAAFLALAFFVGWMPETGLLVLREGLQKVFSITLHDIETRLPLDQLDGIDLYNRARLMDEGIENLENVAHCDLVELMLQTRIPLETLLDWVDQSILILHAGGGSPPGADLQTLRAHGIRTATDLRTAARQAGARDRGTSIRVAMEDGTETTVRLRNQTPEGVETESFLSILGRLDGGPWRLRVILDALADDPWMPLLERSRMTNPTTVIPSDLLRAWDKGEEPFLEAVAQLQRETQRMHREPDVVLKGRPVSAHPVASG